MRQYAPYIGGKTGTSDDENDAWFIGFSNDVTVGVWVGYDNADGKRRTLGGGQTGAKVAIPIFEPMMQAVWANYAPKTALAPPSLVAQRQLVAVPIDLYSGTPLPNRSPNAFIEYFRRDASGQVADTQYDIVSRDEADAMNNYDGGGDGDLYGNGWSRNTYSSSMPFGAFVAPPNYNPPQSYPPARRPPGLFGQLFGNQGWFGQDPYEPRRPRRVDPDYSLERPALQLTAMAFTLSTRHCAGSVRNDLLGNADAGARLRHRGGPLGGLACCRTTQGEDGRVQRPSQG